MLKGLQPVVVSLIRSRVLCKACQEPLLQPHTARDLQCPGEEGCEEGATHPLCSLRAQRACQSPLAKGIRGLLQWREGDGDREEQGLPHTFTAVSMWVHETGGSRMPPCSSWLTPDQHPERCGEGEMHPSLQKSHHGGRAPTKAEEVSRKVKSTHRV